MTSEELAKLLATQHGQQVPSLTSEELAAKMAAPSQGTAAGQQSTVDDGISLGNIGRQLLSGATFGLDDEIVGAARGLAGGDRDALIDEERKRKAAFEKKNPVTSFGAKALGAIAGSVLPVSWLARMGAAGNIARAALPVAPVGRIAGASLPRALHEGGKLGMKGALWQSFGDSEGGVVDRAKNVAENAPMTAGLGYAIGAPFGYFGRSAANIADDAERATRIGIGPDAAATKSLQETMRAQGRTPSDIVGDMIPATRTTSRIPNDVRASIIGAYNDAIAAGANALDAEQVAIRAYAATNPTTSAGAALAPSTLQQRTRAVLKSYADAFADDGGPRMIAAERLAGVSRPLSGALKGEVQHLANAPGQPRSIAAKVLGARQDEATNRTRQLINNNIGGTDYTNFIRVLEREAGKARTAGYDRARAAAKDFDIEPVIAKHAEVARRIAGKPREELVKHGQDVLDWWNRQARPTPDMTPDQRGKALADLLDNYRRVRTGLRESAEQLRRGGDREAAAFLQRFRRDMDAAVARRNREWWRVNKGAAESFRIEEAADMGRKLTLQEGAALQDAKEWFRQASRPERAAFERGLARQFHDKLSRQGDTNDVTRGLLTGDVEWDEGMRGFVTTVLGQDRGRKFLRQLERERTALSTFRLDKGSQTYALTAEGDKRSKASKLMQTLRYGVNPLAAAEDLTRYMAGQADEARDAALAKMLFSTQRADFDNILRSLGRIEQPPSRVISGAFARIPEGTTMVAPGALTEDYILTGDQ